MLWSGIFSPEKWSLEPAIHDESMWIAFCFLFGFGGQKHRNPHQGGTISPSKFFVMGAGCSVFFFFWLNSVLCSPSPKCCPLLSLLCLMVPQTEIQSAAYLVFSHTSTGFFVCFLFFYGQLHGWFALAHLVLPHIMLTSFDSHQCMAWMHALAIQTSPWLKYISTRVVT